MLVYRNIDLLPRFRNAVLTIGTFDGVHTGHQQLIAQMKKRAVEINGETVILTFDPHPRTVINAASGIRLINSLDEKIELLDTNGIDHSSRGIIGGVIGINLRLCLETATILEAKI